MRRNYRQILAQLSISDSGEVLERPSIGIDCAPIVPHLSDLFPSSLFPPNKATSDTHSICLLSACLLARPVARPGPTRWSVPERATHFSDVVPRTERYQIKLAHFLSRLSVYENFGSI